jgi:hypothetical protein
MQTPADAKRLIEDELRLHDFDGFVVSARENDFGQTVAIVRSRSGDLAEGPISIMLEAIEQAHRENKDLERVFELRGLRRT